MFWETMNAAVAYGKGGYGEQSGPWNPPSNRYCAAMYKMKPGVKSDPVRRWALPDRIFFGHGACHILAGVFLEVKSDLNFFAERIIPGDGFAGNHIYVTNGSIAFDYHGFSSRLRLLRHHTSAWSCQYSEGWNCALERVDFDLLSTAELNRRKMLGPDQYGGDPILRAQFFIQRIEHKIGMEKATRTIP